MLPTRDPAFHFTADEPQSVVLQQQAAAARALRHGGKRSKTTINGATTTTVLTSDDAAMLASVLDPATLAALRLQHQQQQQSKNGGAGGSDASSLQARSIAKLHEHLGQMEALVGAEERQRQQQQQQEQPKTGKKPAADKARSNKNNNGKSEESGDIKADSDIELLDDSSTESLNSARSSSAASSSNLSNSNEDAAGIAAATAGAARREESLLAQLQEAAAAAALAGAGIGTGSGGGGGAGRGGTGLPILGRAFSFHAPLPWSTFQKLRRSHTTSNNNNSSTSGASSSPHTLTPTQEANVLKALGKIRDGGGSIHDAVPVVSALLEKLCPELPPHSAAAPGPRDGATFALLAVITGHADLLRACLELGSNPNDQRFLMEQPSHLRAGGELDEEHEADIAGCGPEGSKAALFTSGGVCASTLMLGQNSNSAAAASSSSCSPISVAAAAAAAQSYTRLNAHQLRHGYTPFFVACICEQLPCMEILYEYGASLHTFDRWGRTPLHAAAALGSRQVVDWLVAHGAPRTVPDRDGHRPGELWWGGCFPGAQTAALYEVPTPRPDFAAAVLRGSDANNTPTTALVASAAAAATHAASSPPPWCTIAVPPRDPETRHVLLRPPNVRPPCPCGSGRAMGGCGCVDDMHERWFTDRATARYLSQDISTAIAEAQASVLAQAFPLFLPNAASGAARNGAPPAAAAEQQ